MHALIIILEIFAHVYRKVFGPKLSPEEKKKLDERNRREGWRSVMIGAAIVLLAAALLALAVHWAGTK